MVWKFSLLLTGIHKTPNYFKPNEYTGKHGVIMARNPLFAYSHVYYAGIAAYTNTKEWRCRASVPLQETHKDRFLGTKSTSLKVEGCSTDFHIEGIKFCGILHFRSTRHLWANLILSLSLGWGMKKNKHRSLPSKPKATSLSGSLKFYVSSHKVTERILTSSYEKHT